MDKFDWWHLFIPTVEGRASEASSAWRLGQPAFVAEPIPKNASPNLKLLAEMLRSDTPIPQHVRAWLADMVDPEATSEFQFKSLSRRGRGPRKMGVSANWHAAEEVGTLMLAGSTRKRAIGEVMDRTGLSKSTIEAAIRTMREAEKEHSRVNLENAEAERAAAEPPSLKQHR